MKKFSYERGARLTVPAEVIGATLEEIKEETGRVSPSALVEKSTPKDAPTHDLFEWDDTKAAHQHRLHQARNIIRVVRVTFEDRPEERPVRAYVHTKDGYQPIEVAAQNVDLWSSAVGEIEGKIAGLKRLIVELEELAGEEAPDKTQAVVALHEAFRRVDMALANIH